MKQIRASKTLAVSAVAAMAILGLTGRAQAGLLLENNGFTLKETEVKYLFDSNNASTEMQTDVTGNNRGLGAGNSPGTKWTGGPIAPGSAASTMIVDDACGWGMNNTSGMAGDNYQVSIYVNPALGWNGDHFPATIFATANNGPIELRLGIDAGQNYYAEINGSVIGSVATSAWDSKGLMIQKMNGEFSFWTAPAGTANWTEIGGTSTANVGNNFAGTHLFVKPGGGESFWGYADTFQVQSFTAIPEPGTLGLLGLGVLGTMARIRRHRRQAGRPTAE